MTGKDIREIIETNKNNIAFIFGNGVNLYDNNRVPSWDELLVNLWKKSTSSKSINSIKNDLQGISYTEFFDILDLQYLTNKNPQYNVQIFWAKLREFSVFCKNIGLDKLNEIDKKIRYLSKKNVVQNKDNDIQLKQEMQSFQRTEQKVCDILKCDSTELPFIIGLGRIGLKQVRNALLESVALTVTKDYDVERKHYKYIVGMIQKLNTPILTTNYDDLLERSIKLKLYKFENDGFNSRNPWNVYYAPNEIKDPLDSFAVWHMHGIAAEGQSIKLGVSQYLNMVTLANDIIHVPNSLGIENFYGLYNNESFTNSWLNIFFNKSLMILGLSLDENEIFLRWLLIQRAKYCKITGKHNKGWYVYSKKYETLKEGKRFFLESVGMTVIDADSFDTIYNDIWQ